MNIVFDVDDVILDTTLAEYNYCKSINPDANISPTNYPSDWEIYKTDDLKELKKFISDFFESEYMDEIKPVPDAIKTIIGLKQAGHSISVLSSSVNKPEVIARRKKHLQNFLSADIIDNFCFIGFEDSKKEKLMELKPDIFIDDTLKNIQVALELGIQSILLRIKPNEGYIKWMFDENMSSCDVHSLFVCDREKLRKVKIANDWSDVMDIIKGIK